MTCLWNFQPHDHACPHNQQPTTRPGFRVWLPQQIWVTTALIFICGIKVFWTPDSEFVAQATNLLVCRSCSCCRRTMLSGEIVFGLNGLRGSLHSAQISSQGPSVIVKLHELIETMRGCVTIIMTTDMKRQTFWALTDEETSNRRKKKVVAKFFPSKFNRKFTTEFL